MKVGQQQSKSAQRALKLQQRKQQLRAALLAEERVSLESPATSGEAPPKPDGADSVATEAAPNSFSPPNPAIMFDQTVAPHAGASAAAATASSRFSPSRLITAFVLNSIRVVIMGVGVAAIAGTVLSLVPQDRKSGAPAKPKTGKVVTTTSAVAPSSGPPHAVDPYLRQGKELTNLKQKLAQLVASQSGLTAGAFFLNPETGGYVNLGGDQVFSAASTIKIPVLVAFFQDVDAGKIRLDEQLVMRPDLIASEAGVMQYQPPNSKFTALEVADLMITISDNTATNMLIDRVGGAAALNQRMRSWGLTQTVIQNPLPDLKGTNTTSAKDLATLMLLVGQGELVSLKSRDRLLEIMRRTVTNTLLPQGLEPGATISHKTGDIGTYIGDAGLIDMPDGQRYVGAVMVKRPFNDIRGRELIQQISRATYQTYKNSRPKPPAPPAVKPSPSPKPTPATTP